MKINGLFLMLLLLIGSIYANIRLPKIIGDNMVLQRQTSCAVWGWAAPGENIRVTFRDQQAQTITGSDSSWIVHIASGEAGGPFILTINGVQEIKLQNVMVGEVWICSGQSNMEMPLAGWGKVKNYQQEIDSANYSHIRLFTVPKSNSTQPLTDVVGGRWLPCNSSTVPEFSAVAYFFGRNLHKILGVPIGLINTSWGGTPVESWISRESIRTISDFQPFVEAMDKINWNAQKAETEYQQKVKLWEQDILNHDPGFQADKSLWSEPAYDDQDWLSMRVPQLWDSSAIGRYEGSLWYRSTFNLDEVKQIQKAVLYLGAIDEWDITWLNGQEVGRMTVWDRPRAYTINPELLHQGINHLVIHVLNFYAEGGLWQTPASDIYLELSTAGGPIRIPLAGDWKYRKGVSLADIQPLPPQPAIQSTPTFLFNAMIHPLMNMRSRGVIWYQGETNVERAYQYRTLFPLLITDWRQGWNEGAFPFLFVQLANYNPPAAEPGESNWAELREAQLMALKLKNTGMAVTIDIGEASDIHPKNKQEVGNRLVLIAKKIAYGQNVVYSGPIYERMGIEGDKIRLQFKHKGSGLVVKNGETLQGFIIAGNDRKFEKATAWIEGNAVVVWNELVKVPVAVRYAWADNPQGCNLYNEEGLPASPFRTDDWPGITVDKR
jgi:sialate O-acetylesterase